MNSVQLFHGTTKVNAQKVLSHGFKKIEIPNVGQLNLGTVKRLPGSLGYGLYGFEKDEQLARDLIGRTAVKTKQAVLSFRINLDAARLLDFSKSVYDMQAFRAWKANPILQVIIDHLGKKYRNGVKRHALDGAILEYYIYDLNRTDLGPIVDAVCSTTHTPTVIELANHELNSLPNGIEYVVRDNRLIIRESIDLAWIQS